MKNWNILLVNLEKELEQLKEKLNKLSQRSSENSSQPPSSDKYKKKSLGAGTKGKKRGPAYGHEGKTRNGFEQVDNYIELNWEICPVCGTVPLKVGHLSWAKQRYLVETILGIPMSQGSLAKMHQWFCQSLYPSYEKWWELIQQPGVRCVDETSYRLKGINYWLWVATSSSTCVLFLAPTRSSSEAKSLLGEDFNGILSSDCWSAYGPIGAEAKQKCLAHIERELKALETSHLKANRQFAQQVFPILHSARQAHRNFHSGQLNREQLAEHRISVEAQLAEVLSHPPIGGWAADSQNLANRFRKHWSDWFTFLTYPEVKPDNNDAERALRPVVVHRKVSGGARSHWGGQLVAMIFSFLETMRLQGKNAVEELFNLLAGERSPPQADFVLSI